MESDDARHPSILSPVTQSHYRNYLILLLLMMMMFMMLL